MAPDSRAPVSTLPVSVRPELTTYLLNPFATYRRRRVELEIGFESLAVAALADIRRVHRGDVAVLVLVGAGGAVTGR